MDEAIVISVVAAILVILLGILYCYCTYAIDDNEARWTAASPMSPIRVPQDIRTSPMVPLQLPPGIAYHDRGVAPGYIADTVGLSRGRPTGRTMLKVSYAPTEAIQSDSDDNHSSRIALAEPQQGDQSVDSERNSENLLQALEVIESPVERWSETLIIEDADRGLPMGSGLGQRSPEPSINEPFATSQNENVRQREQSHKREIEHQTYEPREKERSGGRDDRSSHAHGSEHVRFSPEVQIVSFEEENQSDTTQYDNYTRDKTMELGAVAYDYEHADEDHASEYGQQNRETLTPTSEKRSFSIRDLPRIARERQSQRGSQRGAVIANGHVRKSMKGEYGKSK